MQKEKRNTLKNTNPYQNKVFPKQVSISQLKESFSEEKEVFSAGRIVTCREHGRSIFFDLQDFSAKIQCYLRKDVLGEEKFAFFKELNIGDIIGVKGNLFKTKTGEITILLRDFILLSKIVKVLPEKWHGLRDQEIKYRKRYLDLIANPQSSQIFIRRSAIIKKIRSILEEKGFLEVETPILQPIPGGAVGRPFLTHHNTLDFDIYLRIAPELYLKKILVGGFDKIYELNRSFRNEGISPRHNPEFTMLEAYAAYKDYHYMMDLTEEILRETAKLLNNQPSLQYQNKTIDLSRPFRRFSLAETLKKEFGLEYNVSPEEFIEKMSHRLNIQKNLSRSQVIKLIENLIEERFYGEEPLFVIDFYAWMSPLAKTKKDNPYIAERFELFIGDIELANAYTELNDPQEQRKKLLAQVVVEEELPRKIDEDFLEALEYGMPPAAGLGIGIDRLVMVLLNQSSIKDVIFFPLLRPLIKE